MVATNMLHGYKWGISSPEAKTSSSRQSLIESACGKKIDQINNDNLYQEMKKESRDNFFIIRNDKHWSIEEILDKGRILYEKHKIDYLLIDPFNFYSGSGNFKEDNEVLSKIRVFAEKYCSVVVVDHPFTGFTRVAQDDSGFLRIPTKYEVSGGNAKASRTDDFICAHRIINHPDNIIRRTMQISVAKVKDKDTGGEPHVEGEWSELIYEKRDGFLGYWDSVGSNPMYINMKSRLNLNQTSQTNEKIEIKGISPEEAF